MPKPVELRESRRLTGPNLISDGPGAVIDVTIAPQDESDVIDTWWRHASQIVRMVGWDPEDLHERRFRGGASLVIGAPIDALYAACELNEWAWAAVEATVRGEPSPDPGEGADRLGQVIAAERNPALLALRDGAARRGVGFLSDDDFASVGYGRGSLTWPVSELPRPEDVDWSGIHDIPIAMVTGTNGKSTTVRLLAAMARATGRSPGFTSTDGLWIADELVDAGDYSGPGGARTVLRDRRCGIAILETARGGILRRGLAVPRADAVAVLNVADDHMGEYGVEDLDDLIQAKFTVQKAVTPDRPIVLNADDPSCSAHGAALATAPITWFTTESEQPMVEAHVARGGAACVTDGGLLSFVRGNETIGFVPVQEVPITLGGCAGFNVQNALAAVGLAIALDLPHEAIAAGLRGFGGDAETNPGRANLFRIGEITAIVDYAHNSHGMSAVLTMANALPATRRLVTLGQAGDRTDQQIRDLVRTVWRARPDRIVLKEMTKYLRGRAPGEVLDIMVSELQALAVPPGVWERTGSELEAAHRALHWARPGDLLLFSVQAQRTEVIELLTSVQ